jgi:hypothetical protein
LPANVKLIKNLDEALAHYRKVIDKEKADHKKLIQPAWQGKDAKAAEPSPGAKTGKRLPNTRPSRWYVASLNSNKKA